GENVRNRLVTLIGSYSGCDDRGANVRRKQGPGFWQLRWQRRGTLGSRWFVGREREPHGERSLDAPSPASAILRKLRMDFFAPDIGGRLARITIEFRGHAICHFVSRVVTLITLAKPRQNIMMRKAGSKLVRRADASVHSIRDFRVTSGIG